MGWIRLDDDYYEHEKVTRVGPLEELLYVRMIAWAGKYNRDGRIPFTSAKRVAADIVELAQQLDTTATASRLMEALISAGLVGIDDAGDYVLHGFEERQSVASERSDRAAKRSEKARAAAKARWQNTNSAPVDNSRSEVIHSDAQNSPSMSQASPEHMLNDAPARENMLSECLDDAQRCPHSHSPSHNAAALGASIETALKLMVEHRARESARSIEHPVPWKIGTLEHLRADHSDQLAALITSGHTPREAAEIVLDTWVLLSDGGAF